MNKEYNQHITIIIPADQFGEGQPRELKAELECEIPHSLQEIVFRRDQLREVVLIEEIQLINNRTQKTIIHQISLGLTGVSLKKGENITIEGENSIEFQIELLKYLQKPMEFASKNLRFNINLKQKIAHMCNLNIHQLLPIQRVSFDAETNIYIHDQLKEISIVTWLEPYFFDELLMVKPLFCKNISLNFSISLNKIFNSNNIKVEINSITGLDCRIQDVQVQVGYQVFIKQKKALPFQILVQERAEQNEELQLEIQDENEIPSIYNSSSFGIKHLVVINIQLVQTCCMFNSSNLVIEIPVVILKKHQREYVHQNYFCVSYNNCKNQQKPRECSLFRN